jgi:hypothetical protein
MPKVKIDNAKGLVQETGSGLEVQSNATIGGVLVSTNTAGQRDARAFRAAASSGAARTAVTDTTLAVNTHYSGETATALTAILLPSAAAGSAGDWITVFYTTIVNNAATHVYTTTTDTAYALGSTIVRVGGAVASSADVSVALDNTITIAGTTNGDGGIGTMLRFVNVSGALNGWAAEVVTLNQGAGSAARVSAFSAV